MSTHIFRITVRGQFSDLTDDQRADLLANQPDHDIFRSRWLPEGFLTYDERLVAYSFRFELRIRDESQDAAHAKALATATERAEAAMAARGLATKHVRATGSAMSDMWRDR